VNFVNNVLDRRRVYAVRLRTQRYN